jgi:hypothetical protein
LSKSRTVLVMLTGVPDTAKEARRGIMETISLVQR